MLGRRALLTASALSASGLLVGSGSRTVAAQPDAVDWIDRSARPLAGISPEGSFRDLWPLARVVGRAAFVGLGESAHGTHDQFVLKHRLTRFLVERLGFRTLAWEDAWGSGVAIDRYITGGPGDPRAIVGQAGFNLQNDAMLDLLTWLREHNRRLAPHRQVHFLGADVVQLRPLQFDELEEHVAAVAPHRRDDLAAHLDPLQIQGHPGSHIGWYRDQTPTRQRQLIAHARAVHDLINDLPHRPSPVARADADLHALSLRGFYESYTPDGERNDVRDRYIVTILRRWRQRTGHSVIYSAANAHTVAAPSQTVSFPPVPALQRSLAGGWLRALYGRRYVSIGLTFDHGSLRAGWDTGAPSVFPVPPPAPRFVDATLGSTQLGDYILDLSGRGPRHVREWLESRGTMRVVGGASYDPAQDSSYYMAMDRWGRGFDALVHLREVSASQLPS